MASWQILPPEIRLMVLKCLCNDKTKPKVAAYASVSKEWQAFFEARCFRTLSLKQTDIASFCFVVGGRKTYRLPYIHLLRLYISLEEYDCSECQQGETAATVKRNNIRFTLALWKLLSALSAWKASDGRDTQAGLVLELGAYSPSDSLHTYQDFRLRYPFLPANEQDALYIHHARQLQSVTSRRHELRRGFRRDLPGPGATRRVLGGQPLSLNFCKGPGRRSARAHRTWPTVDIVTTVRIRRRFYRMVNPSVVAKLCSSCPRMVALCNEHWRQVEKSNFEQVERGLTSLLARGLPESVNRLSLFRDSDGIMQPNYSALSHRRPSAEIGRQLARTGARLKQVAVSFLAEADDFFAATDVAWPQLTHLALTSSTLYPRSRPLKVQKLLMTACKAALRMPKLQVMELWYSARMYGCVFRFTTQPPAIYMGGSWTIDPALPPWLIKMWQSVAGMHSKRPMTVQKDRYPKNTDGRIHAMRELELRSLVLNPDSFCEMEQERLAILPFFLPSAGNGI